MTVYVHTKQEGTHRTITIQSADPHERYVELMKVIPADVPCSICQRNIKEHSEEEFNECWRKGTKAALKKLPR